ncbi:MAG: hypothetical protein ACRDGI_04405, partial [Candidatus Limnocylindrales bacterium]
AGMASQRIVLFVAIVAVMAGACSAAAPSGPPSGSPSARPEASGSSAPEPTGSSGTSSGPAGLILRATLQGGFIAPTALRTRLPIVSVYADGRILSEGVTPAIYPGPLVPSIVFRSVGPAGAAGILAAAADAGLTGTDGSYGPGPMPDAPSTVITVYHDGRQTVSTFSSFLPRQIQPGGPIQPGASVTGDNVGSAASLLLGRLMGTDAFGGTAGPDGTYTPLGFQVFAVPGAPEVSDPDLARPPLSWPLATPLASLGKADPLSGEGARVGIVSGADAVTLGPILESATQITPFTSGGTQWTIQVKPLLPDEVPAPAG